MCSIFYIASGISGISETYFSCSLIRGFTVSRVQNMGIYYNAVCNLQINNVTLVDNTVGVMAFVGKPELVDHIVVDKHIHFDNSLMVGNSPWMDCSVDRVAPYSPLQLLLGK